MEPIDHFGIFRWNFLCRGIMRYGLACECYDVDHIHFDMFASLCILHALQVHDRWLEPLPSKSFAKKVLLQLSPFPYFRWKVSINFMSALLSERCSSNMNEKSITLSPTAGSYNRLNCTVPLLWVKWLRMYFSWHLEYLSSIWYGKWIPMIIIVWYKVLSYFQHIF